MRTMCTRIAWRVYACFTWGSGIPKIFCILNGIKISCCHFCEILGPLNLYSWKLRMECVECFWMFCLWNLFQFQLTHPLPQKNKEGFLAPPTPPPWNRIKQCKREWNSPEDDGLGMKIVEVMAARVSKAEEGECPVKQVVSVEKRD